MISEKEIGELRDLVDGLSDAITADTETGTHEGNNRAALEFHDKFKNLVTAICALQAWVADAEGPYLPNDDEMDAENDYYEELNRGYAQDRI